MTMTMMMMTGNSYLGNSSDWSTMFQQEPHHVELSKVTSSVQWGVAGL